jgi:hypothetical protein
MTHANNGQVDYKRDCSKLSQLVPNSNNILHVIYIEKERNKDSLK